jgi:hypothetical protein
VNAVMYSAQRGLAMGMKYGFRKGFRAFKSDEATPEMDETAMQGAIGIIIAVGGVLIALYIIAVVVGSISYEVTSGNIKLSPTWNSTITKFDQVEKKGLNRLCENRLNRSKSQTDGLSDVNIDSQAQATFNLANVLPIAIIGVGTVSMSSGISTAIDPNDRDRCFCWSRRINRLVSQTNHAGTMNIAYA